MRTAESLKDKTGATHILSAIDFDLEKQFKTPDHRFIHKKFDLLDFEDEDILTHIPEAVRFIEDAFYPTDDDGAAATGDATAGHVADRIGVVTLSEDPLERPDPGATTEAGAQRREMGSSTVKTTPGRREPVNSVFVHCAMGKSRSVTFVVAWLLHKYPQRWGLSTTRPSQLQRQAPSLSAPLLPSPSATATPRSSTPVPGGSGGFLSARALSSPKEAVDKAIDWVRDSRSIAEPNRGFHEQLQLWWQMGCPIKPGEMEAHPIYARWLYKREVEAAVGVGVAPAPDVIRFEDEAVSEAKDDANATTPTAVSPEETRKEYRCHKCRGRLCDWRFVVDHVSIGSDRGQCPHVYIEPLSWMRPTLEQGEMEGRLTCPGRGCKNQVGRYSWKGFRCSCGEWITPAFSLQKSKIDEISLNAQGPSLNIRMPPGMRENL